MDRSDNTTNQGINENQPPDQTGMTNLLQHLLMEFWGQRYGENWPEFLPGAKPVQLAFDVPMPEGSRLIGSVIWSTLTVIVYESTLGEEELVKFYDDQLIPQGWTKPELGHHFGHGGFANAGSLSMMGVHFCRGEEEPWLYLRGFSFAGRPTTVHAMVHTDLEQSPCSKKSKRRAEMMAHRMDMREVLPRLQPPIGAIQRGAGMSGGFDDASSEAWLKSSLEMSAILEHYNEQLTKAQWTHIDHGQSGPLGWSTWHFHVEDEQWNGMLTLTFHPWSEEYRLRLYAEVEGRKKQGGFVRLF